jgi:hypothetical protein
MSLRLKTIVGLFVALVVSALGSVLTRIARMDAARTVLASISAVAEFAVVTRLDVVFMDACAGAIAFVVGTWISVVAAGMARKVEAGICALVAKLLAFFDARVAPVLKAPEDFLTPDDSELAGVGAIAEQVVIARVADGLAGATLRSHRRVRAHAAEENENGYDQIQCTVHSFLLGGGIQPVTGGRMTRRHDPEDGASILEGEVSDGSTE